MHLHALTVDVEEYFQVEALAGVVDRGDWPRLQSRVVRSTERVLELFARVGVRGTFFTLGWVARRQPALVRRIVAAGHELGCHGDEHRMITEQSRRAFRRDIAAAKATLEDAGGVCVVGYRAPTFSVVSRTRWALDELREAGFLYDSSIYPIRHDRYGIPDAPRGAHAIEQGSGAGLVELPLTTTSVLGWNLPAGGGGYLRLLPLGYNLWALRRAARERPVVVYFHPWELDPGQPRFALPWHRALRAYAGLGRMEKRVEALLRAFSFAPARSALEALGLLGPGPSAMAQAPRAAASHARGSA
jgi:polysaccharide deacetylase family protein (PEP-CTERM system associated)